MTHLAKSLFLLAALVIGISGVIQCIDDPFFTTSVSAYQSADRNAGKATGFPRIAVADLPAEARDTLKLIRQGGPFPYARDGIAFRNREKRLPIRPGGYYREYTVKTPGVRTRGARRIVAGSGGECYFTGDHYKTFKLIME